MCTNRPLDEQNDRRVNIVRPFHCIRHQLPNQTLGQFYFLRSTKVFGSLRKDRKIENIFQRKNRERFYVTPQSHISRSKQSHVAQETNEI